jgi:hypothetical protein
MANVKIKTSLSYSLMTRKCKSCRSGPVHYLLLGSSKNYISPRTSIDMRNFTLTSTIIVSDNHCLADPAEYSKISTFSFPTSFMGFTPTRHKNLPKKENVEEFLMCKCGGTFWGFYFKKLESKSLGLKRSDKTFPSEFKS